MERRAMICMNPPRLEHLRRLTDSRGLMHAAVGDCPDRFAGYDAIDNADALRLCAQVSDSVQGHVVFSLAKTYFEFLCRGRREDGRVYHSCDARGGWSHGGDDALVQSRLARALAAVMVSELPIGIRLQAADWWRELIPHADDARTPLAAGNWLTAIGQLRSADPGRDLGRVRMLADWLVDGCYAVCRRDGWEWFEPRWEQGAACIPEGLWHAGRMLDDPRLTATAEATTRFLCRELFEDGVLVLPGTRGRWFAEGTKARYDQRPADAATLVELLCTAEQISGQAEYGEFAETAVRWFAGHNLRSESLVDARTGGSHDSLTPAGPHPDQGGTAIVAYLLTEDSRAARAAMLAEPPVYMVSING
jgi:hypothetical protein